MTFNQIDACAKLVETLARLELPGEANAEPDRDPEGRADDDIILSAIDDADKLHVLIEQAREILKRSNGR